MWKERMISDSFKKFKLEDYADNKVYAKRESMLVIAILIKNKSNRFSLSDSVYLIRPLNILGTKLRKLQFKPMNNSKSL